MNCKEKALITFKAIQERKESERVQLDKETTKHTLEVAKLAIKREREATCYSIDKVSKIKRRKR